MGPAGPTDPASTASTRTAQAGRAVAGILDQGFVSLANFALGIVVARLVSADDFGAFSVAFAVYLVALNVARMLGTQPLLIRLSAESAAEYAQGAAEATGACVVIGVASGVVSAGLGMALGGPVGTALVPLGLVLPSLLLQDAWRFTLFGMRRGRIAVVNDALWVAVLGVSVVVLERLRLDTVSSLILAWGLGASVSAVAGVVQTHVVPAVRSSRGWLWRHRDISIGFLGSELTQMASSQLVLLLVGAIAGLAVLGSLRAAQLLLGPFNVISVGISLVALPEATRLLSRPPAFRRFTLLVGAGLTALGVAWSAVVLLIPDRLGSTLLGASWDGAKTVLLPTAITMLAPLVTGGTRIALRAMGAALRTFRASLGQAIAAILLGTGGAVAAAGPGAAWGLAAGAAISAGLWWYEGRRATGSWFAQRDEASPALVVPEA